MQSSLSVIVIVIDPGNSKRVLRFARFRVPAVLTRCVPLVFEFYRDFVPFFVNKVAMATV